MSSTILLQSSVFSLGFIMRKQNTASFNQAQSYNFLYVAYDILSKTVKLKPNLDFKIFFSVLFNFEKNLLLDNVLPKIHHIFSC